MIDEPRTCRLRIVDDLPRKYVCRIRAGNNTGADGICAGIGRSNKSRHIIRVGLPNRAGSRVEQKNTSRTGQKRVGIVPWKHPDRGERDTIGAESFRSDSKLRPEWINSEAERIFPLIELCSQQSDGVDIHRRVADNSLKVRGTPIADTDYFDECRLRRCAARCAARVSTNDFRCFKCYHQPICKRPACTKKRVANRVDNHLTEENVALDRIARTRRVILVIKTVCTCVGCARTSSAEINNAVLPHGRIVLRIVRDHPIDDLLRRVA